MPATRDAAGHSSLAADLLPVWPEIFARYTSGLLGTASTMNQPSASVRDALLVVLALTSGAVDAVTFLRLGGVFSSVLTGNLVLLGVAVGQRHAALALNGGLALVAFSVGILAGTAVAGAASEGQPAWPRRATVTLAMELVVLAGFSGGWLAASGQPSGAARLVLLGLAAAAMGLQTAAVHRLGRMSTTYLTSTLGGILEALAVRRRPPDWQRSVGLIVAMIIGAGLGALAAELLGAVVPVVILLPLATVVACALGWGTLWRRSSHDQPKGG
jgi:uncharacterized membrane protein YoaK (UPF0700 family)